MSSSSSSSVKKNSRVCYYYDEEVGDFYYSSSHPMKPHRIRMTHSLVVAYGLFKRMEIYRPYRPLETELSQFHSDDYIYFLKTVTPDNQTNWMDACEKYNIDVDCPIFDGLYQFCQISAGGSIGSAYKLNHGFADIAVNWAGGLHHAKKSEASGFCYVNDIVLAILQLLRYHEHVLYIDIDIHHGDGVEEAFYTTDRVMTVSFHKYGDFFPGTGHVRDCGVEGGHNYALNFPLNDGIDDINYEHCFKPVIDKVIETFAPGAIVLQMGADSLSGDRLGCFNLTINGHGKCVELVKSYGLPLIVLGGGGYTLRNVARCWVHETALCLNTELDSQIPYNEFYEYFAPNFTLDVPASNMVNANTKAQLEEIKGALFQYLKDLPQSSTGIIRDRKYDANEEAFKLHEEQKRIAIEKQSVDERIPAMQRDAMTDAPNEFYENDKDQDGDHNANEPVVRDLTMRSSIPAWQDPSEAPRISHVPSSSGTATVPNSAHSTDAGFR